MIQDYLKSLILNNYNETILNTYINNISKKRYVTLRINTLKSSIEEILPILDELNIQYKKIDWYQDALIILNKQEIDLYNLDIYKEGKIYLQSLSSMLPPLYLNPLPNENILDMTAAPGSKTSQIAALSNNKSLITAVEKNKIRYERLKYNLSKLGVTKSNIINKDARRLDPYFKFDKILLDAPCSGTGTLSLDTLSNFDNELLNRSINTQYELLKKAIDHLKVNGILVYSTCSILKEENELQIIKLLKENPNIVLIPIYPNSELPTLTNDLEGTITVYPNEYYEGFFVAKLKKIK